MMLVLLPEILIAVIGALTSNKHPGAYTHTPEVKKALCSLALVNREYYQWSTRLLYNRVAVVGDQIAQLAVTLSGGTLRTQSLSKRFHSFRMQMADPTQRSDVVRDSRVITEAIAILYVLAPTLRRLFLDTNIVKTSTGKVPELHSAINRFTSLSELTYPVNISIPSRTRS
ncbi:hypothetical protein FRB95_008671 [Tulasnella sp. JGI-2019a]|nr:hypothetical protein FRB95_008671 [Tulasnella sp. JGI-2019a]